MQAKKTIQENPSSFVITDDMALIAKKELSGSYCAISDNFNMHLSDIQGLMKSVTEAHRACRGNDDKNDFYRHLEDAAITILSVAELAIKEALDIDQADLMSNSGLYWASRVSKRYLEVSLIISKAYVGASINNDRALELLTSLREIDGSSKDLSDIRKSEDTGWPFHVGIAFFFPSSFTSKKKQEDKITTANALKQRLLKEWLSTRINESNASSLKTDYPTRNLSPRGLMVIHLAALVKLEGEENGNTDLVSFLHKYGFDELDAEQIMLDNIASFNEPIPTDLTRLSIDLKNGEKDE